ncbi:MAG: hypothetical protein EU539_03740 [Promethearchaeota archaeon]|nr:MAG: hypothetical protein EU539_03740 [Candidatus Lokiarchaeota archaeon]
MSNNSYNEYIYQIVGESIKLNPKKIFEPEEVYLIVDKDLKLIWIWSGKHSRLFHRYMAANWAGKLKSKKKFYNFKYELVKEGREPEDFLVIYDEIKNQRADLQYPGQSRNHRKIHKTHVKPGLTKNSSRIQFTQPVDQLSKLDQSRIKSLLAEIKEIQMHMKYSFEHLERRIAEIEKILD